jgi:predicted DsbA family dithiol-disulfide isomerase
MDDTKARLIAIDAIADVVCPWCYIGKRRLEAAIAAQDSEVHVRWRPYQLDPSIPPDGFPRQTYLAKKFGRDRIEEAEHDIAAAGRKVGLSFAFDKIQRMPNTLDAHRLVRIAKIAAIQGKMVERLFKAYLLEGRDIGDRRLLIELGVETGLDRETLEDVFSRRDDVQSVKDELATTRRLGLTGAPFFIFGEDVVVPGAPSQEIFSAALARARDAPSRMN